MNSYEKELGSHLRSMRKNKGLTLEELANRCGLHSTHIGKIERGIISPTIESLGKIIKTYEITFEDLFRIIESKASKEYDYIEVTITRKVEHLSLKDKEKLLKFLELFFD